MSQPHPLSLHENEARQFHNRLASGSQQVTTEILPDDDPRTERGRQMAALNIMRDPEVRKRQEAVYGEDYCRLRYPEAYTASTNRVGWLRKLIGGR